MYRKIICTLALTLTIGAYAQALTITDGFEGPWDFPPFSFDFATDGIGFDEDWFIENVTWVGDNQFQMDRDAEIKTEGDFSQKANSSVNDGNIRDLYVAYYAENLEVGVEYTITLDYRYDQFEDTTDLSNHIQFATRDGDHRSQAQIEDIEDYQGHERPETTRVDPATFDTGEFHTITTTHTPAEGETSMTFMMIIRFHSPDVEQNWVWLDNFVITDEPTVSVDRWSLY